MFKKNYICNTFAAVYMPRMAWDVAIDENLLLWKELDFQAVY